MQRDKQKYFIITIDTEADNQWDTGHIESTKNAYYIPRFQELSEKYGFKPVWLTTYEMALDKYYVSYIKEKVKNDLCEVGMHMHAWSNPPEYELKRTTDQNAYIYEYPYDVMYNKAKLLTEILEDKFQTPIISHRSGRWATNDNYFDILEQLGYKIDCSATPHVNWEHLKGATGMGGTDYRNTKTTPFYIYGNIFEVPMTIKPLKYFSLSGIQSIKDVLHEIKYCRRERNVWVRPNKRVAIELIKKVIDIAGKEADYIMFMIHSSELMPGGSPNFISEIDIEVLYENIESLFSYIKDKGYSGSTLAEYYYKVN